MNPSDPLRFHFPHPKIRLAITEDKGVVTLSPIDEVSRTWILTDLEMVDVTKGVFRDYFDNKFVTKTILITLAHELESALVRANVDAVEAGNRLPCEFEVLAYEWVTVEQKQSLRAL